MAQQKCPRRKANMTDSEVKAWMLSQCEERPAPYPGLDGPCLIWTRSRNRFGYGQVGYRGKSFVAHRVMFRVEYGRWPHDILCHKCDYPDCVSVAHLFEGSRQDNITDMVQKNRHRSLHGEDHPNRKIDEATVLAIRHSIAEGESYTTLAERYGVHRSLIAYVAKGRAWSHVGGPRREPGLDQYGEKNHQAKITADQVREIRSLASQGMTQAAIGKMFGLGQPHVMRIVRRQRWQHVD